ncbi:hypothetical protein EYF80_009532 [Liparis tanakae]|uniref:Uncharacterized protein n=1 Tax=Liparis tanakae TaxID=230148 RepID=A0A4Z2IR01_9TELE|nr:hypothetical protein EYF80_009532 [Liparis tanakae]
MTATKDRERDRERPLVRVREEGDTGVSKAQIPPSALHLSLVVLIKDPGLPRRRSNNPGSRSRVSKTTRLGCSRSPGQR